MLTNGIQMPTIQERPILISCIIYYLQEPDHSPTVIRTYDLMT